MRQTRQSLIYHKAECFCGAEVDTRNAVAWAHNHARRTGHDVVLNTGFLVSPHPALLEEASQVTSRVTPPLHSEVFAYALANNLLLPGAKRRLTEERSRTASAPIDAAREKSREAPTFHHNCPASFSNFDAPWMQRN